MTDDLAKPDPAAAAGAEKGADPGDKGGVKPAVGGGEKPIAAAGADKDKGGARQDRPTIASGEEADKGRQPAATWPEDWRTRVAGDDKAALKTLERLTDPSALWKSYQSLQKKLGEKGAEKAPDEPEALKAWRKERGIPETADGYLDGLKLADGRSLGETDKAIAKSVAERLHGRNVAPDVFADLVGWYFDHSEDVVAKRDEDDDRYHDDSIATLKEEWGADYKKNQQAIAALFNEVDPERKPDGLFNRLLAGRTADGRRIGDDPDVLKFLAGLGRELHPAATVVGLPGHAGKDVSARIAELKGLMAKRDSEYWKGPNSDKLQAEYRDLLVVEEKMKSRGQAA